MTNLPATIDPKKIELGTVYTNANGVDFKISENSMDFTFMNFSSDRASDPNAGMLFFQRFSEAVQYAESVTKQTQGEKMTATYDNEMLCSDCTMYVVNRDDSGNSEEWNKEALLDNLSIFSYFPTDETEDFSTKECGGCGTDLAGYRHEFSIEKTGKHFQDSGVQDSE